MSESSSWLIDNMKVRGGRMSILAFLEKYNGTKFVKYAGRIPRLKDCHLQNCATGVYFLMQGHEVVYVGQTGNIKERLKAHKAEKKKVFDMVRFIADVPSELLDMLEAYYIMKCKPAYNKNYPVSSGPYYE